MQQYYKFLTCMFVILSTVLTIANAGSMPHWVQTSQTENYTIYHDANNIQFNKKSQYIILKLKAQHNDNQDVYLISDILINCNSNIVYKKLPTGKTIALSFTEQYNQMCIQTFKKTNVISPQNSLNDIFDA